MKDFSELHFVSRFFDRFNRAAFLTPVMPTPVKHPKIIAWSDQLAEELGIASPSPEKAPSYAEIFSGNRQIPTARPFASRYGGHQFGHWAGQLGDGRAIIIGEAQTKKGVSEFQLKGSGRTPYSRSGDGRAVLRSSIREFLCSEAMFNLNIPTTRALSLVSSGEPVVRDMFYDGRAAPEPGAIVCRVSPSFLRFGHFEMLSAHDQIAELRELTSFVIEEFYPSLLARGPMTSSNESQIVSDFFKEVATKTAHLMAHWMSVGFVHGVMNTDNMSILGLTIDYGPYGWLDDFDFDFTPNTTDAHRRRYRYAHQPAIGLWNMNALANALFPLVQSKDLIAATLEHYQREYERFYLLLMSEKLGVSLSAEPADVEFLSELLNLLSRSQADYTLFFRRLSRRDIESKFLEKTDLPFYLKEIPAALFRAWEEWGRAYFAKRAREENKGISAAMNRVNPAFIFRNYLAQETITAATQGDYTLVNEMLTQLKNPFTESSANEFMRGPRPEWAKTSPGCSMLSCSS